MDFLSKIGNIASNQFNKIFSPPPVYTPPAPNFSIQSFPQQPNKDTYNPSPAVNRSFDPYQSPLTSNPNAFPLGAGLNSQQTARAQQVTGLTNTPQPFSVPMSVNGQQVNPIYTPATPAVPSMERPAAGANVTNSLPSTIAPTHGTSMGFTPKLSSQASPVSRSATSIAGQVSPGGSFGGSANILAALSQALGINFGGAGNAMTGMTPDEQNRKKKKSTLSMIQGHETRGMTPEEAYRAIGVTGDLGSYQVNPETLKTYADEVFGRQVSQDEFLSDPQLQEQFAPWLWKHLLDLGFTEEEAVKAWNLGVNGVNNPAKRKIGDEYYKKVMGNQ